MRVTRRTQPYRKRSTRPPSKVLANMQRGKTLHGQTPSYVPGRRRKRRRVR